VVDLIPSEISAGITFDVPLVLPEYPAPDWSLSLALRGPAAIDLTAVGAGDQHTFSVTAATTAGWTAGRYWWQVRASFGADVVLIDTDSPGRDVLEQVVLVSRDQPRPIVMFTDDSDPEAMRQAIRAGVSAYIVEGIQAQRLKPILDVAMARFESDQAIRAQLQAREQQLAERKRIELAKGMLMKMRNCKEEEAYTLMRRQAMSRQQKLIQVAEQIIAMNELLGE